MCKKNASNNGEIISTENHVTLIMQLGCNLVKWTICNVVPTVRYLLVDHDWKLDPVTSQQFKRKTMVSHMKEVYKVPGSKVQESRFKKEQGSYTNTKAKKSPKFQTFLIYIISYLMLSVEGSLGLRYLGIGRAGHTRLATLGREHGTVSNFRGERGVG